MEKTLAELKQKYLDDQVKFDSGSGKDIEWINVGDAFFHDFQMKSKVEYEKALSEAKNSLLNTKERVVQLARSLVHQAVMEDRALLFNELSQIVHHLDVLEADLNEAEM
ncbi:hypothetical protein H1S01_13090 [Heliobacterium chlorum]|uniref:Uncharacterized protein n=1 Tax=Heliobacterium chlorum TaxID=2698 RepID=A0ABR7T5D7_HELCL|nr:hypothetical protein [Heliobacterium chlorum]MBC9785442.1 hypothetical protein [Heliobacterium chlorum]